MNRPLVLYHAPCQDGFTAAWAAWKYRPDAELVGVRHGDAPPDVTGRYVYILDFCYPKDVLLQMAAKSEKVTVIDHHRSTFRDFGLDDSVMKTALPVEYDPKLLIYLDINKSGAGAAWDYFQNKPRPWIVDYVEDRDLWRFKLKDSKSINAFLMTQDPDLDTWIGLAACDSEESLERFGLMGSAINRKVAKYVSETSKQAYKVSVMGYDMLAVNAGATDCSELLHHLCQTSPSGVAMSYFMRADGIWQYSLRSSEAGPDVSAIAKHFGGGGHVHAAGFQSPELINHPVCHSCCEDEPRAGGCS
jgi:hypothetical protein